MARGPILRRAAIFKFFGHVTAFDSDRVKVSKT